MLQGTIPTQLRSMIEETARGWPPGCDVYIACSGNFTIERVLAHHGFRLHSNDVSIYTCALGRWLTGRPVGLRLKDPAFEWLAGDLDDGIGSVATIMEASNLINYMDRPGRYYRRMMQAYRDQWPSLLARTRERLGALHLDIAEYAEEDCRDYLARVPENAPVITFPPFYGGGYEKLYAGLEKIFDWDAPEYRLFEPEDADEFFDMVASRPEWVMATNHEKDTHREMLTGYIQPSPSPSSAPFWVYSKTAHTRISRVAQKVEPVFIPRLTRDDELDGLEIVKLKPGQFKSIRLQYLNAGIATSIAADVAPWAVTSGGRLIGMFAYGQRGGPDTVGLLTDLAIDGTGFKRLSKLVIMAAVSTQARDLMEQSYARKLRRVRTTVFSKRQVSMKYRGLWDRVSVEEQEAGAPLPYKLVYQSPAGRWSLDEALAIWKDKWGARS